MGSPDPQARRRNGARAQWARGRKAQRAAAAVVSHFLLEGHGGGGVLGRATGKRGREDGRWVVSSGAGGGAGSGC